MTPAMSAIRLRNALKKIDPALAPHLKNDRVNGIPEGCSGFVANASGDRLVYVRTGTHDPTQAMYRTAEHLKDFTGGTNRWATHEQLPEAIADLLHGRTR